MVKIDIILPYKELFTSNGASAVSISVKNSIKHSKNKKNITVYGQYVEKPFSDLNFVGIKTKKFLHFGNNLSVIKQYLGKFNLEDSNRLIELHNRPYLFNYLLNKKNKRCVILYFHNDPLTMKGSKTKSQRLKILKEAAGVVFVSKFLRDKFLNGINESFDNTYVIPNSLDKNQKIALDKKLKNIIFVGRIVKEKGAHIFINAIKELSIKFSDWKFLLIGSSKLGYNNKTLYEKEIIKIADNLGDNVEYHGYLSNEKVKDIMSKGSILVVPSIWEEPFGMTAIEGLSNKMSVISSDVGGLTEIVKDKGILIKDIDSTKLANKIEYLIQSPAQIKKYQNLAWNNYSFDQKEISILQDKMREKIFKFFFNSPE
tara:strand:- start:7 stop:1119 length:1113 start_codon:yes stop_codon:yes gene_type:complete